MVRMRILPQIVHIHYKGFWHSGSDSANTTSDSTSQTLPEVTLPDKTRDDSSPLATFHVPSIVWIVLAVLFIGGAIAAIAVVLHARHEQKEEEERILRKQKRLARLEASGISQEEFDLMLERKRSSYTTTKKGNGRYHGSVNRLNPFKKKDQKSMELIPANFWSF